MPPASAPRPLRVVFFGTPDIAVPTLERLIAGAHEVVGVVSQPDRARGRGRKQSPSPVAAVALREEIPLLRPERVGEANVVAALEALTPDIGVVVAFGQFIPKQVRELPSRGYLVNAHASLLPRYRGAAPIARAIADGERETGISVMRVEKEMDAGPVALVEATPIGERENTAELSERLAELAASAIERALDRIARDEIEWIEQDASRATFAEKLQKSDALLDLRADARALANRIHALSPKPGGSVTLVDAASASSLAGGPSTAGGPSAAGSAGIALKISRADATPFEAGARREPGTIDRSGEASGAAPLRIATGDGWLVPLVLQRSGGKALPVSDFLRGFEISPDARCALLEDDERESDGDSAKRTTTADAATEGRAAS